MAKLRLIAGLLALLALLAGPARAEGPAVSGPAETVYRWAEERCATWDVPDTPARAWRAADGSVRLVAGSEASRAAGGARARVAAARLRGALSRRRGGRSGCL